MYRINSVWKSSVEPRAGGEVVKQCSGELEQCRSWALTICTEISVKNVRQMLMDLSLAPKTVTG